MKFLTNFNEQFKEVNGEVYTKPSMTQPDHTYKIRDIIKRAEAGQFIPVIQGNYDEDGQLLAVRKPDFDLTDVDTIKSSIKELDKVKAQLKEAQKEKEAKEQEAANEKNEAQAKKEAE